nr:MAG TPA: hypothetical protein [Caudoviricetes sp.]
MRLWLYSTRQQSTLTNFRGFNIHDFIVALAMFLPSDLVE